jgi:hypothetical protein
MASIVAEPLAAVAVPLAGFPGDATVFVMPAFSAWLDKQSVSRRRSRGINGLHNNKAIDNQNASIVFTG